MDIFTTQLTRVVPIPIKPASLKVKALLKEAGASKLKEDPDHLENHDYYFVKTPADNEGNKEDKQQAESSEQQTGITDEQAVDSESKEEVKHLDLYV